MVTNARKRKYVPSMVVNPNKRKYEPSWQEIAAKAQNYRDTSLASADRVILSETLQEIRKQSRNALKDHTSLPSRVLQPKDITITESLPEELVALLASRELTATDVTAAFLRRAVVAQTVVGQIL